MLHAPVSDPKNRTDTSRTRVTPEAERELHPRFAGPHSMRSHAASDSSLAAGLPSNRQHISRLQSSIGNQSMLRSLSKTGPRIQTKLTVNEPGDRYEQEADQVADKVMRMPLSVRNFHSSSSWSGDPSVQRKCACGGSCSSCQKGQSEEEQGRLQLKPVSGGGLSQPEAPPTVHEVLRSSGQPLDPATRAFMEQRFGHDFSQVRVHAGAAADQSARDVNAHAYTVGHNIVFANDQYSPGTYASHRLIAHELSHVLQQEQGDQQLRRWATCYPARFSLEECPPREKGEIHRAKNGSMVLRDLHDLDIDSGEVSDGILVANFDIGSAAIKPNLQQSLYWKHFLKSIAANRSQWKLVGFTDCEVGKKKPNERLRVDRAKAILNLLPHDLQAQITLAEGAPSYECVTENNTASDRAKNRSVAFILEKYNADFAKEPYKVPRRPATTPDISENDTNLGGLRVGNFDFLFRHCDIHVSVSLKFVFTSDIPATAQVSFKRRFLDAVNRTWGDTGWHLDGVGNCPCLAVPIRINAKESLTGAYNKRVDVEDETDHDRRPFVISDINVNLHTSDLTLAHEFGHALGLYDEYEVKVDGVRDLVESLVSDLWHKNMPKDTRAIMVDSGGDEMRDRYFENYRRTVQDGAKKDCWYIVSPPTAPSGT